MITHYQLNSPCLCLSGGYENGPNASGARAVNGSNASCSLSTDLVDDSDLPAILECYESDVEIIETPIPGPSKQKHQQSSSKQLGVHDGPECPLLLFPLREDLSGYGAYPWGAHKKHDLPWTPVMKQTSAVEGEEQDVLYLRSTKCTNQAHPFRNSLEPCQNCQDIAKHSSFDGIVSRANDGCKESTPYHWLSPDQHTQLLRYKQSQLVTLRLSRLNQDHAALARTKHLEDYKRLLMAVASGDVKRVDKVVSVALKNGCSVSAILERVQRAAKNLYNAKSFTDDEIDLAYVMLRFAGARGLDIISRALGLPSVRRTRLRAMVPALQTSASTPTAGEIEANFRAVYARRDSTSSLFDAAAGAGSSGIKFIGLNIMADEIALQQRLRWDPSTNKILGFCREHSSTCSLSFLTADEALLVRDALVSERIHFASEVSRTSILTDVLPSLTLLLSAGDCCCSIRLLG